MSRLIDRCARWYRRLLVVYPACFRDEYGDEMTRVFHGRLSRARTRWGALGAVACLLRALIDVAVNAPLLRLRARRHARRHGVPPRSRAEVPPSIRRSVRRSGGDWIPRRILGNVRYAVRTMRRQPVLVATIVLTLAIGTGATISIFGIVDAALVRPLPYPDAERILSVRQVSDRFGSYAFGAPFLQDLRDRVSSLDPVVGFSPSWSMTLSGAGEPRRVLAAYVSDGLLRVLGARIAAGRPFEPEEHLPGGPPVALVSQELWNRHFGVDTPLEGQTIRLGGHPHAIVGIVAGGLRMPVTTSAVSRDHSSAELWLPFASNPFGQQRNVPVMHVIGRLAVDVTPAEAAAELETVRVQMSRVYPDTLASRFQVVPLAEQVTRRSRTTVFVLFAAALLLLTIACANVANLMLARASERSRELAIRSAMGATKARLMEQVLTESLLLAVLGCGTGLLLAAWLLSAVPGSGLEGLPPSAEIRIDARVAGFAVFLALATAVSFGLVPAIFSSRLGRPGHLHSTARGAPAGSRRVRNALVVAEVALAFVLLVGAGLLARSFWRLTRVDPGFDGTGLVSVSLSIGETGYVTTQERRTFLTEVLDSLARIPGVETAAAVNRLPLGGRNVLVGVAVEDGTDPFDETNTADRRVITPGYFDVMGVTLIDGRPFDARDTEDAEPGVTIVNRRAARLYWGERDPVGRRIRLMLRDGPGPWMTVVGVVGNIRHHGLDQAYQPEVYVPYSQAGVSSMVALVRGTAEPEALIPVIRNRVRELSSEIPLDDIRSVESVISASVSEPRFRALLLNSFAMLAMVLALIGISGVISFSVARRTRDIGIRMALGARRGEILWVTLREGLMLGAVGAGVGLVASVALGRLIDSLLFEVEPTDPFTFVTVTVGLLTVVVAASYLPARRATRIDPVEALRAD